MSWLETLGEEYKNKAKGYGSLFKYLFPPREYVERLGKNDNPLTPDVDYSLFIQVGRPKSGKTTAALTIAALVEEFYDGFKVSTVLSNTLPNTISLIPNDVDIAVLIVDDAPVKHPAYGGRRLSDAVNVATYFMMRHLVREKSPNIKYVIIIFNTQRYWSLDVAFREASDVDIFKSIVKEPREKRFLKKHIGKKLFRFLQILHKQVFKYRLTEPLNYFVYYTTWSEKGIGVFEGGPKKPKNLIVDEETKKDIINNLLNIAGKNEASSIVLKLVESLGRMGISWSKIRDKLLPYLREEYEIKIATNQAFKFWRKGRGQERVLVSAAT